MLRLRKICDRLPPHSRNYILHKLEPAPAIDVNIYTEKPEYPPILDTSHKAKVARAKEAEYEEIKKVKTVEEKQIKLNMPRYYGFKCYMLEETNSPYNQLGLTQHVTRTHLKSAAQLPDYYSKIETDTSVNMLKSDIEEAILMEFEGYQKMHDLKNQELKNSERNDLVSLSVSRLVNRVMLNNMSGFYPHLLNTQMDIEPRIESFWYAGGMKPPNRIKRIKAAIHWRKDEVDEPTNRAMNYLGKPNLALRTDKPLPPIVSDQEAENADLEVPFFEHDPRTVVVSTQHRHIANIPGFWPGDPNRFGLLSYHRRGHLIDRPIDCPQDHQESLHRQGILASFGWLNAQANFLGFTTFNDITYPLTTQTIITDGQFWSFYAYQLNTLLVHSKHVYENPKRNICWATPEMKLFEQIQDGKLVGFNEDVLRNLVKFYANVPEARQGVDMTPYLGKEEKVCADYAHDEKREWLEREFKFLTANRPRYNLPYEVYLWEKIYKIDNETRFMERRRRPFELKIDPWKRPLNERKSRYIPRCLRPDLPRHKGRDSNEYFP